MGSYDGAEVCALVGNYLMSYISAKYSTNIGIYRDDGIAAFNKTPKQIENIKKDICKTSARQQTEHYNKCKPENSQLPRHHTQTQQWNNQTIQQTK